MKRAILTSILVISFTLIYGQGHDIIWENSYGGSGDEGAYSGCLASDGGYIIAGLVNSNDGDVIGNHGLRDAWIIKIDISGDLIWQKCIGSNSIDYFVSINNTNDGGYIAAGACHTNSNGNNMWLVKLDFEGNIEWDRSLGGTGFDVATHAIQTSDGGYICVGNANSIDGDVSGNHGLDDCWVVKLDSYGNLNWKKCFGGSGIDLAKYILELEDGSFVFVGHTNSDDGDVSFNHGYMDVWVVNIDPFGNLIWENSYGGSGSDYSYQIVSSINGGFTIAAVSKSSDGDITNGHGLEDIWIVEIDSQGELIWEKCFGGSNKETRPSLLKSQDSGNIIVGCTSSNDGDVSGNHGEEDCWIIKINTLGDLEWQQCYGGSSSDRGKWIFLNTNGNYMIPGLSNSTDGDVSGNHGDLDFWVFEIEGQESLTPIIPISSAGIVITILLIFGAVVIRRVG